MQAFLRHRQHALRRGAGGAGTGGAVRLGLLLAAPVPAPITSRGIPARRQLDVSRRPATAPFDGGSGGSGSGRAKGSPSSSSAAPANGGSGSADAKKRPPSIEETLALLAAEVRELRREVDELRQARADGGLPTVRAAAEGRRFLSVEDDGNGSSNGDARRRRQQQKRQQQNRPPPLPTIGENDDEAERMSAAAASGRTGGLAVVGSDEEEGDDFEGGGASSGSDSDSDDADAAAEALFEHDERLVLPTRPPSSSAAGPPRASSPPSTSAADLAARWRAAERERQQQQQQQARRAEGAAATLPPPPTFPLPDSEKKPLTFAPAQRNITHGGGGARMSLDEFRALPQAIYLVRHAESMGNADMLTYANTPDYDVQLSERGWQQAVDAGRTLRDELEGKFGRGNYRCYFYVSPYCRTRQTFVGFRQAFEERCFAGLDEDINLREQEFSGGLQTDSIRKNLEERMRYGRFFFRFPQGESTADVYLRQCIFEDSLLRSLRSGRHGDASHVVIIGHGIALRVLLMRLLGWTVESFLQVHNPPNATPLAIEKISEASFQRLSSRLDRRSSLQVRQCYRLSGAARRALRMDTDLSSSTMDLLHQQFT